jgi:hypothetical protein
MQSMRIKKVLWQHWPLPESKIIGTNIKFFTKYNETSAQTLGELRMRDTAN